MRAYVLVLMLSEFCIPQLYISNNKRDGAARLGLTTFVTKVVVVLLLEASVVVACYITL